MRVARSTMTFQRYLVLAVVTLTASFGDTFLSRGMKAMGPVSLGHPAELIRAIFSPWVAAGIVLLIGFFSSYLTALSWADLTFVLPASSLGYVIMTLLARFWLKEHVSPMRWLGVVFITAGVGFVTRGPSYTDHSGHAEGASLGAGAQGAGGDEAATRGAGIEAAAEAEPTAEEVRR